MEFDGSAPTAQFNVARTDDNLQHPEEEHDESEERENPSPLHAVLTADRLTIGWRR